MNNRDENWFSRNRKFIFGFALVMLVLNIVVAMLLPSQTPVSWSGETTEYAVDDETFAEPRTVVLEGTLTSSVIGGACFDGTLTISGYDELDGMTFHLKRKNKRWVGYFASSYGQATTTAVHELYGDKELSSVMLDFWTSIEGTEGGNVYYSMDFEAAHFLALGSVTRSVALREYQNYVPFAQK